MEARADMSTLRVCTALPVSTPTSEVEGLPHAALGSSLQTLPWACPGAGGAAQAAPAGRVVAPQREVRAHSPPSCAKGGGRLLRP